MNGSSPLLTAILAIVGVVIGASLQHWFSRLSEDRKQTKQLQTQAYVDYLRAVSQLARGRASTKRDVHLAEVADAKARICLYGTREVVSLLSQFEQAGAILDNPDSRSRFAAMCCAMRGEADKEALEFAKSLQLVLFGPDHDSGTNHNTDNLAPSLSTHSIH